MRDPVKQAMNGPDSVMEAPRGNHSENPQLAYEAIERAYLGLLKIEMFARSAPLRVAWGDQA